MKLVRTLALTLAAAGLSVGLVGVSGPAHASDISWGYAVHQHV